MNDTVQSEIPWDISHFREVRNKREIQEPNLNETIILVHFFVLWTGTLWHASKQSNFKPVHMSGSTAHDVAET